MSRPGQIAKVKSESEKKAKDAFKVFLRSHMPEETETKWSEGADPPDYNLVLAGQEFAVEVSDLQDKVAVGGGLMRRRDVRHHLEKFIREVERSAQQDGILFGEYCVNFPRAIPNLRKRAPLLKEGILAFLRSSRGSPPGVEQEIDRNEGRPSVIKKWAREGSALFASGPTDSSRAAEAEKELAGLIAERITEKTERLSKLAQEKILLLGDLYLFAERDMYDAIATPASGTGKFHTIYVHRPYGGDGVLLTSRFPGLVGIWDR